jgi:hypothetical protein
MTMTFIFSGKWIGAGWASKLNEIHRQGRGRGGAVSSGAMSPMKLGNDVYAPALRGRAP